MSRRYSRLAESRSQDSAPAGGGSFSWPAALGLALLLLAIIGGIVWAMSRSRPVELTVLAAMDVSGSHTREERKKAFGVMHAAYEVVFPSQTPTVLWEFDQKARKVYEGQPVKARDLWPAQDAIVQTDPKAPGTYPEAALQEMQHAARLAEERGVNQIVLILMWDGETHDAGMLRNLASQLASDKKIKAVWVIGAKSVEGIRSYAEKLLEPLNDRLIVTGSFDARDGLERLRVILEKGE
jgi:hypothetical protein